MRKTVTIFAVLIAIVVLSATFCLSAAASELYYITSGVYPQITLVNQEPDPAEPGQTFTAKFKIENTGGEAAKNFVIEVIPEYPFSLYTGNATRTIGSVAQYDDDAPIVDFMTKVDSNAVEGTAKLKIRFKFDTSDWVTQEFDINIRTHDAMLLTEEIKTPANVAPGGTADVQIVLKNSADSPLKSIKAKLDLSSSELPFGFVDSIGEKSI